MGTQLLVLMQMTFLNNVRKVGRLVLSRTSCYISVDRIMVPFCAPETKFLTFKRRGKRSTGIGRTRINFYALLQ
jgi:hypothetical protein